MTRASRERGNFQTRTLCLCLLIANGWETTAGDPVVLGFTFELGTPRNLNKLQCYSNTFGPPLSC